MNLLGYETRCSLTGNQMKIVFSRDAGFGGVVRLMMRYFPRDKIQTKNAGTGFVAKIRPSGRFLDVLVDVQPIDILAFAYMALIRWRFSASCSAVGSSGEKHQIIFRGLDPAKYPGHCMIVSCYTGKDVEGGDKKVAPIAWVLLTPFDLIRIRDVFLWEMVDIKDDVVIDTLILKHGDVTRLRMGGGPEVVVTKPMADFIVRTLNEIIAVNLAERKRNVGAKHGAVAINNLPTKPFAVANVSVGGMAIPLDRLNTVRLLVHMSIAYLRMRGTDGVSIFSVLEEDLLPGSSSSSSSEPAGIPSGSSGDIVTSSAVVRE